MSAVWCDRLSVLTQCVYCLSSSNFLNELVEDKIKGFPISGMSYAEEVMQLGALAIVSRQTFDLRVQCWKAYTATWPPEYDAKRW